MLLLSTVAFACPSLTEAVERMTQAVVSGVDPAVPRADISASLQCAPASASDLASWYLAEGAASYLNQDPSATRWFVAARRLAPDRFDDRYGSLVRSAWEAASTQGTASITVDLDATVNGQPVKTWPYSLDAGPVVVQVVGKDGAVRFYRTVELAPGEAALVPTLLSPETALKATKKKKSPALLIAGGTAAVLAGVAGGIAIAQNNTIDTATSVTDLDAAATRQKALGYSAYGLGGLAVLGFGLYFVVP